MSPSSVDAEAGGNGTVTYDDFLAIEDVTMSKTEKLMRGELGEAASAGYVAYAVAYYDGSENTASYLIVQDMEGSLLQVAPLYGEVLRNKGLSHANEGEIYKGIGLKNYNSTHLLVAFGKESALTGPRALFDVDSGAWIELCDGESNDSHDIQMAYKGAALWQADGRTVTKKFSAADGSELAEFQMTDIADPNHVQLVEEDKYAFVSSRQTDGIVRVHVATGDVHNAEYFGDDEFCLFDNQEASASSTLNASRLLCLRLDEAAGTATVTFEKVLDSYTPHFGDNDRLPSGNQLGVSWPKTFSTDDQYDVRAIEVVRSSGDLAWQMDVVGVKCDDASGTCDRGVDGVGWTSYSIERFYAAPIVSNATCDKASGVVRFDAVNNFKQNNVAPATYAVSAAAGTDKPYATGDFDFKVHWRQTPVAVDLGAGKAKGTRRHRDQRVGRHGGPVRDLRLALLFKSTLISCACGIPTLLRM
ncbi:hypothetical protein JL720_6166 [Aureococcus anophagefferens]|nr:hypothetical protein JL720_6166 [Aureococcus anophagefferens]